MPSEELVYLIQGGPYHKIGRTKNLKKRIKTLQTGHPYQLQMIKTWTVPNSTQAETSLHHKFISLKIHGDWFNLEITDVQELLGMDVIEVINLPPPPPKPPKPPAPPKPRRPDMSPMVPGSLRAILVEQAGILCIADFQSKVHGMSRQQAWALWHGKDTLGLRVAKRIADATGLSLDDLAEVGEAVPASMRAKSHNGHDESTRHPLASP